MFDAMWKVRSSTVAGYMRLPSSAVALNGSCLETTFGLFFRTGYRTARSTPRWKSRRSARYRQVYHGTGPYIQDYKLDILGCDPRYERIVDYCLTWGDVHEEWLKSTGSGAENIRIGNLLLANPQKGDAAPAARRNNALILQYATPHADLLWPQAGQYGFFVAAARAYRDAGYRYLRLKLHPGPSKVDYYQRIAELFDIDCDIVIEGPFMDHVDWAGIRLRDRYILAPCSKSCERASLISPLSTALMQSTGIILTQQYSSRTTAPSKRQSSGVRSWTPGQHSNVLPARRPFPIRRKPPWPLSNGLQNTMFMPSFLLLRTLGLCLALFITLAVPASAQGKPFRR